MKKIHIIILILIAGAIALLISTMGDLSTYDTIASSRKKQGEFVHLIAQLDRTRPVKYDPVKDPNYLSFYVVDSLGGKTRVVYKKEKPAELEHSDRIVLKGRMRDSAFVCEDILLKCPSKYKDDKKQMQKELNSENASAKY